MNYRKQAIVWRVLMILASVVATLIGLAMIVNNMLNGVGKALYDGLNGLCSLDSGHCNSPMSYRENSFTSAALTPLLLFILLSMVATIFLEISSSGKRFGQKELPKVIQSKAVGVGLLKAFTLLSVYVMIAALALTDNSSLTLGIGLVGFVIFLPLSLFNGRKLIEFEQTVKIE